MPPILKPLYPGRFNIWRNIRRQQQNNWTTTPVWQITCRIRANVEGACDGLRAIRGSPSRIEDKRRIITLQQHDKLVS